MRNARLWIIAPMVGLLLLLVGLLVGRATRTDDGSMRANGGPMGAEAPSGSAAPSFTYCNGTYALCTTADCTELPGDAGAEGFLSCPCKVKQGYSAGQQLCAGVPTAAPSKGQSIPSRYYPVSSVANCKNGQPNTQQYEPWAWCLDMPCIVDTVNGDGGTATCICVTSAATGTAGQGEYVVVTDDAGADTCSTGPKSKNGFISSATVSGVEAITNFYRSKSGQPFPVKTVNDAGAQPVQ